MEKLLYLTKKRFEIDIMMR